MPARAASASERAAARSGRPCSAEAISASTLSASAPTGTAAAVESTSYGQVRGEAERQRERAARRLQVALGGLEVELRLARGRPRLQHVGDGGEPDPPPLLGRREVGLGLGQRGPLGVEQRAVGQVLEVGHLDLQHDVLDRGVVGESGREELLARALDPAAPPAEVEQQVGQRDAGRRAPTAGPPMRPWLATVLMRVARHVAVHGGQPLAARRAVGRGGGLRVGPGEPGVGVVPEPDVHDLRQREPADPLGEVGGAPPPWPRCRPARRAGRRPAASRAPAARATRRAPRRRAASRRTRPTARLPPAAATPSRAPVTAWLLPWPARVRRPSCCHGLQRLPDRVHHDRRTRSRSPETGADPFAADRAACDAPRPRPR